MPSRHLQTVFIPDKLNDLDVGAIARQVLDNPAFYVIRQPPHGVIRSDATPIEQRLVNDVQTHTVLSVETFSRYNDGIIQASFLRAAHPIEINYRDTPVESRLMLDLLRQMIRYADRQQGEALAEFLLAIACGRLRLVEGDLARLRSELKVGIPGASALASWLADCIANRYEMLPVV